MHDGRTFDILHSLVIVQRSFQPRHIKIKTQCSLDHLDLTCMSKQQTATLQHVHTACSGAVHGLLARDHTRCKADGACGVQLSTLKLRRSY